MVSGRMRDLVCVRVSLCNGDWFRELSASN